MCTKRSAVFLSNAKSEIISLDQVSVRIDYQLFNLGNKYPKNNSVRQSREIFSVTHAKESFRLSHILAIVLCQLLTRFYATFPTIHTQQILPIRGQCGSDPHDQQKSKNKSKVHHKNAQSRFGLAVVKNELGPFFSDDVRANNGQLTDISTNGMFITMQWNSLLTLW